MKVKVKVATEMNLIRMRQLRQFHQADVPQETKRYSAAVSSATVMSSHVGGLGCAALSTGS